jgi:predicted nucleotide-binding protein
MAKRTSSPPEQKLPARLTPADIRLGIGRLERRLAEVQAFDPKSVTKQFESVTVTTLRASIDDALVSTFGGGTLDYDRYRNAAYFDYGPINMVSETPLWKVHEALERSKSNSIALLEQAIRALRERLAELTDPSASPHSTESVPKSSELSKKVFVVHGHDGEPREAVARFLQEVGLDPIILHEQPNQGRAVIEKFEAHGDVGFAVILMTPDDVGKGKDDDELKPRARQNVVLELGYFMGRLGRNRVCVLKRGDIEVPSDFAGVVYVPFDLSAGWKQALARELQEAGYAIDWNVVMRRR